MRSRQCAVRRARRGRPLVAIAIAFLIASALVDGAAAATSVSIVASSPAQAPVSSAIAGAALPAAPAAGSVGQWDPLMDWGVMAKHMALLPTGKVLFWSIGDNARVWDPSAGTFDLTPATFGDLHCAGQSTLADGRVIVVGGQNGSPHNGISTTSLFDPFTETWTRGPDMAYLRWYATSTTLADGRVLATSGDAPDGTRATIPEVYDPVANTWTKLTTASRSQSLYPLMFVLPNGKVYESGPGASTAILDPSGTGSWTAGPSNAYSTNGYSESAVMYRPGKILRAGGGDPAQARASVVDMTAANPAWRDVTPMAYARRRMNLTILADGTVLAIGGTAAGDDATQAVLPAELWNPTTETWTTMSSMAEPRMYHSSAILLPDGRIVVGGGEADGRLRAQIYSPPYLFKGPRPVIDSAPATVGYGSTFAVSSAQAGSIASVALIRTAAATHAFDQNQRYVPLSFTSSGSTLTVTAPPSGGYAPPGYYLLVITDTNGVPSVASFVRVDSNANLRPGTITGTVTDAATQQVVAGATVSIAGTSTSTDGAGHYTLSSVPAGDQAVTVTASGYAKQTKTQTVAAGGSYTVDFQISPPGSIGGTVTDATTGAPIAGAVVTFPGGDATTAADGSYAASGVASGQVTLNAAATGYVGASATATVPAGGSATANFALQPAATYVTGEVRDLSTNNVLPGATVRITGGTSTQTDSLGRYRIDLPGGDYTITASNAGYDPQTASIVVTTGLYTTQDFGLTPTAAQTSLAFDAVADTNAKSASPTKNYGKDATIRIRAGTTSSPGDYATYLRFSVTGLAGRSVSAAAIRLHVNDKSVDGGQLSRTTSGWTETGLTWNNAPAAVGPSLADGGAVALGAWATYTLPAGTITGDGSYDFVLRSRSTDSAIFDSRESANHPRLELTVGGSGGGGGGGGGGTTAPVASFTANPTTGTGPFSVTVTDSSTGGPTSWTWSWGDGSADSTGQAPAPHVYAAVTATKTYTLKLTASNTGGTSTATTTITVQPPSGGGGGGGGSSTRLEDVTFEDGITGTPHGADKVSGTVAAETTTPIAGTRSARFDPSSAAYLEESFSATSDLFLTFDLRLGAVPTTSPRILQVTNAGTTYGNLVLTPAGGLRLRNGSTTIGKDSSPLQAGAVYTVGLHQRAGTGANGLIEAYVAPLGTTFGAPFATSATGTWTTPADRVRIGATNGSAISATIDDLLIDGGSMPTGPLGPVNATLSSFRVAAPPSDLTTTVVLRPVIGPTVLVCQIN